MNLAQLDGYLNGIASISGNIREYSANAQLLNAPDDKKAIRSSIINFFSPEVTFKKIDIEKIKLGFAGLELDIQNYILDDVAEVQQSELGQRWLLDRRKYLSFRVMDLIYLITEYDTDRNIYKVAANFTDDNSTVIFYCIPFDGQILVLQFLHNQK